MEAVEQAVARAEASIDRVGHALDVHGDEPRSLRAAADGAARLVRSMAALADGLAARVCTSVGDSGVAEDLVADLRALRNCLATGAALVDPALADLRALTEQVDVDREFAARWREWAAECGGVSER